MSITLIFLFSRKIQLLTIIRPNSHGTTAIPIIIKYIKFNCMLRLVFVQQFFCTGLYRLRQDRVWGLQCGAPPPPPPPPPSKKRNPSMSVLFVSPLAISITSTHGTRAKSRKRMTNIISRLVRYCLAFSRNSMSTRNTPIVCCNVLLFYFHGNSLSLKDTITIS